MRATSRTRPSASSARTLVRVRPACARFSTTKCRSACAASLRQVRDAEDLVPLRERGEPCAHVLRDGAADAGVHLVEDEHAARAGAAQHIAQRQEDARELASRRHAAERAQGLAGVRAEAELHGLGAAGPARQAVRRRGRQQRHLEARARERQLAHRGAAPPCRAPRPRGPVPREARGVALEAQRARPRARPRACRAARRSSRVRRAPCRTAARRSSAAAREPPYLRLMRSSSRSRASSSASRRRDRSRCGWRSARGPRARSASSPCAAARRSASGGERGIETRQLRDGARRGAGEIRSAARFGHLGIARTSRPRRLASPDGAAPRSRGGDARSPPRPPPRRRGAPRRARAAGSSGSRCGACAPRPRPGASRSPDRASAAPRRPLRRRRAARSQPP